MASNKRPRKAYRPKPVSTDPISHGICGAALFMPWQRAKIMAGPEAGFNILRQGKATNADWNEVSQAFNISEKLCFMNIGNNLLEEVQAGIAAMSTVAVRMMKKDAPTALYAAELSAIRHSLDLYAVQIKVCTQGEFTRAVEQVKNMLNGMRPESLDEYLAKASQHKLKEAA